MFDHFNGLSWLLDLTVNFVCPYGAHHVDYLVLHIVASECSLHFKKLIWLLSPDDGLYTKYTQLKTVFVCCLGKVSSSPSNGMYHVNTSLYIISVMFYLVVVDKSTNLCTWLSASLEWHVSNQWIIHGKICLWGPELATWETKSCFCFQGVFRTISIFEPTAAQKAPA